MGNRVKIKLATKLTTEVEMLLGAANTSMPGIFVLHASEGKLALCRQDFLPKEYHPIAHISRANIKDGLTAAQWSAVQEKIIKLLLSGGLKL